MKMGNNIYPLNIHLVLPIENGIALNGNTIYNSQNAISIQVKIDNNFYLKEEVAKCIKEACQKLLEYYC